MTKKFEIFSGKSKELSKNGKNEAKTPDKQKNDAKKTRWICVGKIVKSKEAKTSDMQKNPIAKKPDLYCSTY